MSVVVIGLEHQKAPFDVLERVIVPDVEVGKVLTVLRAHENVREAVLVSTCLRTEVYVVVDRFHDAVDDVMELLAERSGVERSVLEEHQSVYFDRGVATHLFRVAAGLESAVPGETEVLGQVRRSLERATDEGAIGPSLSALFRAAVSAGRKVRTATGIARGTLSFSHASVELAEAHLGGDLGGAKVVLLGAGDLAAGTLSALIDPRRAHRPSEVVVVNRTGDNARAVVDGLETDVSVRVSPLDALSDELRGARLLITAVESELPVVDGTHTEGIAGSPLLILDLGMPRNVAHAVGEAPGVDLLDISDLRSVVEQARDERRSEVAAAEAVIVEEVARYLENERGRGAAPIVVALRERLDAIRHSEVARRSGDLSDLSPAQREAVEALTRSIVAKLVHEPTVALKESAGTQRGERLVEAARQLFGL